jgi:UDP-glucose 4-epimerase
MKYILISGGLGYIGLHVTSLCNENGYYPIIIDNYSNSSSLSLIRLKKLNIKFKFFRGCFSDKSLLQKIFNIYNINEVIHLAAFKSINESFDKPNLYLINNYHKSVIFFNFLKTKKINNFIFSSTACLYDSTKKSPFNEFSPIKPNNPYGKSKLYFEEFLLSESKVLKNINIHILRYFNPIGSHPSGLIGEFNWNNASNIIPNLIKASKSINTKFQIYGADYQTKDKTAIRDYVDIMDIATAHILSIKESLIGIRIINLGSGKGISVLELVKSFNKYSNSNIEYEFNKRRKGDAEAIFADISLALNTLDWYPKYSIKQSIENINKFLHTL